MKYLLLQNPGHNRVYFNVADKLALTELKIASLRMDTTCNNIEISEVENIRYLSLETDLELNTKDLDILSRLSFVYAIFQLVEIKGARYLMPIKKVDYEYLDSKIGNILKYQGKTNELFTKMMINVAMLSSNFNYSDKIQLLDPVVGKGTTLFEGAVNGFDCFGIEIDSKAVHESSVFFKRYLETGRLKYNLAKRQVHGKNRTAAIFMQEFEYALTKEDFKTKDKVKKLGLINGDTQDTAKYFSKKGFHLIVGDLPYGIVHANSDSRKISSGTRNPSELLELCLPEWHKVLRNDGVVVMAWNSFLANRHKLSKIFKANGFDVFDQQPYDEFEHMVDKSIKRDIIVAKKVVID